jgi:hypothetical protein
VLWRVAADPRRSQLLSSATRCGCVIACPMPSSVLVPQWFGMTLDAASVCHVLWLMHVMLHSRDSMPAWLGQRLMPARLGVSIFLQCS